MCSCQAVEAFTLHHQSAIPCIPASIIAVEAPVICAYTRANKSLRFQHRDPVPFLPVLSFFLSFFFFLFCVPLCAKPNLCRPAVERLATYAA
jgi:putative flippase GtrA